MQNIHSVDQYIAMQAPHLQGLLQEIRRIIQETAPDAEECISYRMPAYRQGGYICFFASYKNHIGFYPLPGAIGRFGNELRSYKTSKGAIQFPVQSPLPVDLIKRIVQFRLQEVHEKKVMDADSKMRSKKNVKKQTKQKSKQKNVKKKVSKKSKKTAKKNVKKAIRKTVRKSKMKEK